MGGLKCRACRRLVLRRWHVVLLIIVAFAFIIGLLELIQHLTPPPIKTG